MIFQRWKKWISPKKIGVVGSFASVIGLALYFIPTLETGRGAASSSYSDCRPTVNNRSGNIEIDCSANYTTITNKSSKLIEKPDITIKDLFVDYELQGNQFKRLMFTMRGGAGMEVESKEKEIHVLQATISPEGTVILWPNRFELQRVPGVYQLSEKIVDSRNLTIIPATRSKPAIEYLITFKAPTNEKDVPIPAVYVYKIRWVFKETGVEFYNQCIRQLGFPDYLDKKTETRLKKASEEVLPCDRENKASKREKSWGYYSELKL